MWPWGKKRERTTEQQELVGRPRVAARRSKPLSIDDVLAMLNDPDAETRVYAAKALRKIKKPQAIEPCIERLMVEQDIFVRGEIAKTLYHIGDERIIEPFLKTLEYDAHWYVRLFAVKALGASGGGTVTIPLVKALLDSDCSVRTAALEGLERRGWRPGNDEEKVYYLAAKQQWEAFQRFGAQAVKPLLRLLTIPDVELRQQVFRGLQQVCRLIRVVFFGTTPLATFTPPTTLVNPDTSEFTISLSSLRRIDVDPTSYDPLLLERFLTYAVNYIGEAHLKEYVDVHIYGNLENVQPNLRNVLTNLCHHVKRRAEYQEMSERLSEKSPV